jgi:hypothetical protein
MTIKAQTPGDTITCPPQVKLGDRFVYLTPDGRAVHYEVCATDVVAGNGTPGCVKLRADESVLGTIWGDVTIRPEGLASSYGWAREAGTR